MNIKSIEIKGFKSFPDKTTVNFDQGITGIVGPNGCGKSNIVDAIRWVVGEQKISSLRSENLENLVFNGSKTRSASGLAEVNVTFENTKNLLATEFNTVTITRRFYRTGESEYRLNNVVCRLKDIQNLLLDTGISSDSYAIIELGMIDDIIRDKDNSRRKMLEQAAGISIFKTRKRETQLKLQATEQDLARLEDILFEINNQLKDLETQSRRALRYLEIKKKYKEVSVQYAKLSLGKIQTAYKEHQSHQQELNDKLNQIRADIQLLDAETEKEKLSFTHQEQQLKQNQTKLNQLEKQLSDIQNQKNLNEQQLNYNKQRIQEIHAFIDNAHKQIKHLEESILFTQKNISEEQEQLQKSSIHIEEKRKSNDEAKNKLHEQRNVLNQLIQRIQVAQQGRFESEKQVALQDAAVHNLQLAIQEKEEQQQQFSSNANEWKTQLQSLEQELEQHEISYKNRTETSNQLKETILQLQQQLENERNLLSNIHRQRDSKQNEHDLIKNLIDTLEGYPDSVKYLHKNPEWKQEPLLSDLFTVQDEYKIALERYLDPYMNFFVVQDASKASSAIHLLKKNKKGKVNFFTLSQIEHHPTSVATPEGCFPALEVVQMERHVEPLIRQLLANVFIQPDSTDDIPQQKNCTIIGKDGTWISRPHNISGGSLGSFEGSRIGRRQNLEKISEHIQNLQLQIDEKKSQIAGLQEQITKANQSLNENNTEQTIRSISQTKERIINTKRQLEDTQHRTNENHTFLENASLKVKDILAQKNTHNEQLHTLQNEENQLKNERTQSEELLKGVEEQVQAKNTEFNELQIQFTKQQNKIHTLGNELQYKSAQLEDIKKDLHQKQTELSKLQENSELSSLKNTEFEHQTLELLKEKEVEQSALHLLEQAVDVLKNHILEQEKNLRQLQLQKEKLEQEDFSIKERFTAIQIEIASIKERLLLEFKIDIEEYLTGDDLSQMEGDLSALKEQVDKHKRSIENLGDVNPMAVEAFETHQKRYNFIIQQKTDLVKAKDNLVNTIQEVEQTVNQNFLETFNQVRSHFQKVFKALFTEEDTADLILDQPDNFAESGIDIIAKPKGKRPSSIRQLSGGEKSLTAIALLFSLYLIKPAPFCVLDEVDAPLDDANVSKFTKMVREFSKDSQFIIVTHNKSTMASVDVIYGVTMQETGVSKIVPVDFRNLN